jgi:hypothetical protein
MYLRESRSPFFPSNTMPSSDLCIAKTQSIVENTLAETSCCISAQDENRSGGFFRNRLTGDVAPLHGEQESREPR